MGLKYLYLPSGVKAGTAYGVLPNSANADFSSFISDTDGTRIDKNGFITDVEANVPRLDYTGGGCPSLLLEPTSINYTQYSEDFTQSYWTKENNATIESDVEISPTGSLNASYLKAPVGTGISPRITQVFGCASGQTYTGSVFVKKDNIDYIRILSTGATASTLNAYYNVSNGTLGVAGSPDKAKIEDYGNGWYRLSLVINATQNTGGATFRVQLTKSDNGSVSNFDGTEKSIIFGAQLEQQAYATSYIPTNGSTVTRSQDVGGSTGDISSVFDSREGTFFFEGSFSDFSSLNRISLNSSITTNEDRISIATDSTRFLVIYEAGDVGASYPVFVSDIYANVKIAVKWSSGSVVCYTNGTESFDRTNIGDFSQNSLDRVTLANASASTPFRGRVKQFKVYDEALSNAEMVELTTL